MSIRFMFLRDKDKQPIGCIAVDYIHGRLEYGLSVLNPKDKFDRRLARSIAIGRWGTNSSCNHIPFVKDDSFNMHLVSSTVMKHLIANKAAPARARKAAKLWLQINAR